MILMMMNLRRKRNEAILSKKIFFLMTYPKGLTRHLLAKDHMRRMTSVRWTMTGSKHFPPEVIQVHKPTIPTKIFGPEELRKTLKLLLMKYLDVFNKEVKSKSAKVSPMGIRSGLQVVADVTCSLLGV